MQIAYLDCFSGISGDMMLGALVDAGAPLARLNDAIGSLGLPGCRLIAEEVKKLGVRATQVTVQYQPEHAHRHLGDILAMIRSGRLSARQRELAERIFTRLAEAEAKVHGIAVEKVHFHEVGAADSIADVVGTAVGWDLLGIGRAVASAVPTGTGRIRIAHGDFSVPAPATAELLLGIPLADDGNPARTDHAHRRGHPGHPGRRLWPAAGHDHRADRLRRRPPRPPGATQRAAAAAGPSDGRGR